MKTLKSCAFGLAAIIAIGLGFRGALAHAAAGNLLVNVSSPYDTNSADWSSYASVSPNANVYAKFSVPNSGWYESFLWCDAPNPALAIPQALGFNAFVSANPFTANNPSTGVYGSYIAGGNYLTFPAPYCNYGTPGIHQMTLAVIECQDSGGTQGCNAYTATDPITVGGAGGAVSAPAISASPTSFNFTILTGSFPSTITPSQVISFASASGQPVSWTAATSTNWIAILPSGTGPATVILNPIAWGLIPGTYTGTITFSFPGTTAAPQTVTLNLTVAYPVATAATVSPTSLSFSVGQGSNPASQMLSFKNLSTNAQISATCGTSPCWLAPQNFASTLILDSATGLLDAPEPISVNSANLAQGSYAGAVTVSGSASGLPITVPVTLTVGAPGSASSPSPSSGSSGTGGSCTHVSVSASANSLFVAAGGSYVLTCNFPQGTFINTPCTFTGLGTGGTSATYACTSAVTNPYCTVNPALSVPANDCADTSSANVTIGSPLPSAPAGGSCTQATLGTISASSPAVAPGASYSVSCDFGSASDFIPAPADCTYSSHSATTPSTAIFTCTAPSTPGTVTETCEPQNQPGFTNFCSVPAAVSTNVTVGASAPAATVAQLAINGTSFALGQPWTLNLVSNVDNAAFSLCASQNGGPTSCAPSFGSTIGNGSWTLSGTFSTSAANVGSWQEWVQFPSGATSNKVSFALTNPNGGSVNSVVPSLVITPAPNAPIGGQVAAGSTGVPLLTFTVANPSLESVKITSIALTGAVTGNAGMLPFSNVTLWSNGVQVGGYATNNGLGETFYLGNSSPFIIPYGTSETLTVKANVPAVTSEPGIVGSVGSLSLGSNAILAIGASSNIATSESGSVSGASFTVTNPGGSTLPPYAQLSINGSTAPNRSFTVGSPWTLSLATNGTFVNTPFSLCYQNGPAGGSLGAASCASNFSTTDANGNWTGTGTFAASTVGNDQEWVTFPSSGFSSNQLPFIVTGQGGNSTNPVPTVSISASQASVMAGQTATISWSSTNATSCTASGPALLFNGPVATAGTMLSSPLAGTYTYVITCTGPGGTSPSASTTVTVTPTSATPNILVAPSAPQSFTATPGDGRVTLSWSAPASLGSPAVTGYLIDDKPSASYAYTLGAGPLASSATSTVITGLTNGTSYDFEIFALNSLTSPAAAQIGIVPMSSLSNSLVQSDVVNSQTALLRTELSQLITSLTSLLQEAASQGFITQDQENLILSSISTDSASQ